MDPMRSMQEQIKARLAQELSSNASRKPAKKVKKNIVKEVNESNDIDVFKDKKDQHR